MLRNKEGKHYASPSRYLKALTKPPLLELIEDGTLTLEILKKVQVFGNFVEQALELHLDFNTPLNEIEFQRVKNRRYDWDKDYEPAWLMFKKYLKINGLTPIDYEIEVIHEKWIYHGRVDLLCKDKNNKNVYIEIKTRNTDKIKIKHTDLMQLKLYKLALHSKITLNKDKETDRFIVLVLDRKGRCFIDEELIHQTDKDFKLFDDCVKLIDFYNYFIRKEIDHVGFID